jgi:hypothetical protein
MGPRLEREHVADAVEYYENHAPWGKTTKILFKEHSPNMHLSPHS